MNRFPDQPWFPPRSTSPIAITHVHVVPMDVPNVLPDQTALVEDGKILAIGPASEIPIDGAQPVDGSGKYLLPGLADMHVHYWDIGEFGMFLANGVTLVRNMWGSPFHLALQKKLSQGEFPGPRVITTSPIIDGPGPTGNTIWPGSPMASAPAQAGPMVRQYAERGYQQIKVYSWLAADVLHALGQASASVGLRMVGHCPDSVTYEEAIEAGMTCFEHLTGIARGHLKGGRELGGTRPGDIEAMRLIVEYLDPDSVHRLAHFLAAREIWNCPTAIVWQSMSQDKATAMSSPLLRYERPTTAVSWDPANDFRFRHATVSRAEWLAVARERNELYLRVISILHDEGAPLLLGTDTPNPFVFQGFSIHQELLNLVAAGLSPYEALRCGTAEAARFVGEEDRWGAVRPGRRADLLLVADNPLEDVAAVQHPDAVFVNGYYLARSDLDTLLEQREQSVSGSTSLPDLELHAASRHTEVIGQGLLTERLVGANAGRAVYRHARLPDGGWEIEEQYAGTPDGLRSPGGVLRTRLRLSPSFSVSEGEYHLESFLGRKVAVIHLQEDGSYAVRCTEIDGYETVSRAPGQLLPGEDLALSVVPLLLRHAQTNDAEMLTLTIEEAEGKVTPLWVSRAVSSTGETEWHVGGQRGGTPIDRTYRFARDGTFLGMEELSWRGRREVVPETATEGAKMSPV